MSLDQVELGSTHFGRHSQRSSLTACNDTDGRWAPVDTVVPLADKTPEVPSILLAANQLNRDLLIPAMLSQLRRDVDGRLTFLISEPSAGGALWPDARANGNKNRNGKSLFLPAHSDDSKPMKCPACGNPLREKRAGGIALDTCYGGCGGIWFDTSELERVSARAATTLHTIWNLPVSNVKLNEPRWCPRCTEVILERKWFSDLEQVEIDQCPRCEGIWLDAGEFTRVYDEIKGAKVSSPLWKTAMAEAAKIVEEEQMPTTPNKPATDNPPNV